MKLIEFPQQTVIIAKDQAQYRPMPAWIDPLSIQGRIICCWQLTWGERIKLLLTGKLWHYILTFNKSIQPQLLQVDNPFKKL